MINAAFVRECKPRATMYEVTCDALPGFILRVLPTCKKVALVRYRVDGKDRRVKIGLLGAALSIDEARRRTAVMLADVAIDTSDDEPPSPRAAGKAARVKQVEPASFQIVTLRELTERFVRTYVDVYLKPGTAERYRHQLETIILPGLADEEKKIPPLGDRDYRTIKRADVSELHGKMKDTPGAANNMFGPVLNTIFWRSRPRRAELDHTYRIGDVIHAPFPQPPFRAAPPPIMSRRSTDSRSWHHTPTRASDPRARR